MQTLTFAKASGSPTELSTDSRPRTLANNPRRVILCVVLATFFASQTQAQLQTQTSGSTSIARSPANQFPPLELSRALLDDASLRSVHFIDPDQGWAVGDCGVILKTIDGGTNWLHQESGVRCRLLDVTFRTSKIGIAVGGWYETDTGMSRGVILRTNDGGDSWTFVPGELPLLQQVWFRKDGVIIVAGDWSTTYQGRVLFSEDRGVNWTSIDGQTIATVESVEVEQDSVLITDQQGILYRVDRLGEPPVAVSVVAAAANPNNTNPATKKHIPGGNILAGVHPNAGTNLPLHDVFFLDNFRGWGVGAFGTILTSRDGGQTWRSQRQLERGSEAENGRRAMVLGVSNRPRELPWPVLASESLESGHRVAMAIADPPSQSNPLSGNVLERTRDAATRVGGGEVAIWNSETISQVLASYRPSVVVLGADLDPVQRQQWLDLAIAGKVARVFEVDDGGRPDITLQSSAVLPAAAAITGDLWSTAMEILQPHLPIGARLNLKCRWDQSQASSWRSGVADGLPNLGAMREVIDGRRRNLQVLQARSGEQALVDRLFLTTGDSSEEALQEKLLLLIKQTPPNNRQPLLRSILSRCVRDGSKSSLRLFVIALAFAAEHFADAPLGYWAHTRYQTISASSEWQALLDDPSLWRKPKSPITPSNNLSVPAYASPFERLDSDNGRPAEAPVPPQFAVMQTGATSQHSMQAMQAMPTLPAVEVDLFYRLSPPMLAWKLKFGEEMMDGFDQMMVRRLIESPSAGPWRSQLSPVPVRPIMAPSVAGVDAAGESSRRPLLDGVLDEACWLNQPTTTFHQTSPSNLPSLREPREVRDLRFAYDGEFLYLGLREMFSSDDEEQALQRRVRDADTTDQARVVIQLDIDRDFWTAYELTVDQAGQTRDTCDGFTDWHPRWYVASKVDGGVRTVEAAIRREDLTHMPPVRGDRWRVRGRLFPAGRPDTREAVPQPDGWRDLVFD